MMTTGAKPSSSRANGDKDDAYFDQIMSVALDWYKIAGLATGFSDPSTVGFSKPLYPVWNSVTRILRQTKELMNKRNSGTIKHNPRVVVSFRPQLLTCCN